MSEAATARANKAWMPNRMFDPVSNPFAVQNLLAKEAATFKHGPDGRPQASFVVNSMVHEDSQAAGVAAFKPDAMGAAPDTAAGQSAQNFSDLPQAGAGPGDGLDDDLAEPVAAAPEAEAENASEPVAETVLEAAPEPEPEPLPEPVVEPLSAQPAEPDLSSQAVTSLIAAALEEGRAAGYKEGFAEGYAKASADLKQTHSEQLAAEQAALAVLCEGVQQLANDGDALFEPLKRLSIHLAEQLVRGELSLSGHAISRLVDNCVREMTGVGEKTLQVQLHPEDLEQYRPLVAQYGQAMSLRANPALKRGSVRVSLESSVVEDLIEHRLEALAKTLTQPASGGGSGRSPLSARLGSGEGRQSAEVVRSRPLPAERDAAAPSQSLPSTELVTATVLDDGYV